MNEFFFDTISNELVVGKMAKALKECRDLWCINERMTAYGQHLIPTKHINLFDKRAIETENKRRETMGV